MISHKLLISGIVSLLLIILSISSCTRFTYNQNGYPKKIHFSSQGGSEIISGNYDAYLYINDDNDGDSLTYENDTVEYAWLKVVRIRGGKPSFELTAAPNENPTQRKLQIELYLGTEYGEITVTQKGR
ncbi:MAG: hypothetical protein K2K23_01405 [Muribaculaceae bacterium]|nr:hypothetical protein [Muribaculaceae bacterium]